MKKLFLLISALVVSFALDAATINITEGTNKLQTAVAEASAGDVIVLAAGTYSETGNFDLKKNLTIQSAEGTHAGGHGRRRGAPVLHAGHGFRWSRRRGGAQAVQHVRGVQDGCEGEG